MCSPNYPEPYEENRGFIAQQCLIPGTNEAGSYLFTGNLKANPKLLSPAFRDTAKLFEWMHKNGWRKEQPGSVLSPYVRITTN